MDLDALFAELETLKRLRESTPPPSHDAMCERAVTICERAAALAVEALRTSTQGQVRALAEQAATPETTQRRRALSLRLAELQLEAEAHVTRARVSACRSVEHAQAAAVRQTSIYGVAVVLATIFAGIMSTADAWARLLAPLFDR